jgi:hypothetical protein
MSSLARAAHPQDLVCVWDHGTLRAERVTGFADAFRKVWRAEGVKGLWKGAGTTLCVQVDCFLALLPADVMWQSHRCPLIDMLHVDI